MNAPTFLTWSEKDTLRSALWRSDQVLPKSVVLADDTMTADTAYRLACAGTGLLWRSDFQNARQMLQALTRRIATEKPYLENFFIFTSEKHQIQQWCQF